MVFLEISFESLNCLKKCSPAELELSGRVVGGGIEFSDQQQQPGGSGIDFRLSLSLSLGSTQQTTVA